LLKGAEGDGASRRDILISQEKKLCERIAKALGIKPEDLKKQNRTQSLPPPEVSQVILP
jgi:hypothetical protein